MCETVAQYFASIHVAVDIRDGAEWRNAITDELVARGESRDHADDVRIANAALRIVTEKGWMMVTE